jgi:hypothetical protein
LVSCGQGFDQNQGTFLVPKRLLDVLIVLHSRIKGITSAMAEAKSEQSGFRFSGKLGTPKSHFNIWYLEVSKY